MPTDNSKQQDNDKAAAQAKSAEAAASDDAELEEDDDDADAGSDGKGVTASKGRPTPSRRQREEEADKPQGNFITRFIDRIREYLQGVRSEVQKVVWPTREEWRRLTQIVIIALIVFSIILGIISGLFTELMRVGLDNPIVLLVFMVFAAVALFFIGRYFNTSQDSRF